MSAKNYAQKFRDMEREVRAALAAEAQAREDAAAQREMWRVVETEKRAVAASRDEARAALQAIYDLGSTEPNAYTMWAIARAALGLDLSSGENR